MKIDRQTAERINRKFVEREDIIQGVYTTRTKTVIPVDVFTYDGIEITLHTELRQLTLLGGKSPEDYTTTLMVEMGGARVLVKDPCSISTTAGRMTVYDDRFRIVFEIQITEE